MSIRTYIFALLTSLVLMIAVILSYQSASIFVGSFDKMTQRMMTGIAKQYPEQGKVEQDILGYHVTTDWQLVPQQVRDQFSQASIENNILYSKFVGWVFIAPPEKAYVLMAFERDGKKIFISLFNENVREHVAKKHHDKGILLDPMQEIILVGTSGLIIFVLVLLAIFKKITVPVESLQAWGKGLTINDINKPRPDFRFKELNAVATLMHDNLVSVAESIEREQTFLSYASHELRTPIAVIRSNAALLEKVNPNPSDNERKIRDRIQRASLTMKSITETLLWLSREGDTDMPIETSCLGDLVQSTQAELTYLLAGKLVTVNIDTDETQVDIAVVPSLIVLNNLIRNAFQHTQQGQVTIVQRGNEVIITNIEECHEEGVEGANETQANKPLDNNELGFGLGMQLVEKLTKQFGWRYTTTKLNSGYSVSVFFS